MLFRHKYFSFGLKLIGIYHKKLDFTRHYADHILPLKKVKQSREKQIVLTINWIHCNKQREQQHCSNGFVCLTGLFPARLIHSSKDLPSFRAGNLTEWKIL